MVVTKALHVRSVAGPAASLVTKAVRTVFEIGVEGWMSEKKPQDFADHIRAAAEVLKSVAAEVKAPTPRPKKKSTRSA